MGTDNRDTSSKVFSSKEMPRDILPRDSRGNNINSRTHSARWDSKFHSMRKCRSKL